MTASEFLEKYDIETRIERVSKRLDGIGHPMARHYKITFITRRGGLSYEEFSTYYSQGVDIEQDPKPHEVFYAVVDDARTAEYDPFDFLDEFGYRPKEGKKVYYACVNARMELLKFLGRELFDEAINIEEDDEND